MATQARIRNQKIGDKMVDVAEHKHDGFGWHWASAGHRDDGQIHKNAAADKPVFPEGFTPTAEQMKLYMDSLNRVIINQIPSKAKPKDETPATPTAEKPAATPAPSTDGAKPATARERQPASA
jgi:hypothetical protein